MLPILPRLTTMLTMGRSGHGLSLLAAAMALGIAIGHKCSALVLEYRQDAVVIAIITLMGALVLRMSSHRRAWSMHAMLSLTMTLISATWYVTSQHYTAADDLSALIGNEQVHVRVRGVALASPQLRGRFGGAMARFDYRQPATYFPLKVEALIDRYGIERDIRGEVLVRVDETVTPFHAGDQIEASGFLLRPAPPRNPGEFDYAAYAKSLGQAGFLSINNRDVSKVMPADRMSLYETFLRWRDDLRRRAGAWLLSELPENPRSERDSLLKLLMLGERDEQIDGVQTAFQRVGLAHLLAISGFHLGVLAGFVLLLMRLIAGHRRWHGLVVIVFVLLYLLLVEARMPVLRAGVMTVIASVGLLAARRFHIGGLCALSAIALLLWRPDQLFDPGFQLTFGVVFGLIYVAPVARERWFGPVDPEAATAGSMLKQWFFSGLNVAVVAWVIALPIVVYHFGMISLAGVAMSVITVPLASVILALGFLKIVTAALLPSVGLILGLPLSICTDMLVAIVMTIDTVPLAHVTVPIGTTVWALVAMVIGCWWLLGDAWVVRRIGRLTSRKQGSNAKPRLAFNPWPMRCVRWVATASLIAWLLWQPRFDSALRIDMLSVGDGSCYLIRDAESAVLFDAGSSTDLNVARRTLIPALRRLNVRSIAAIVISHPDLDHYSAVVELASTFHVHEVVVTPQYLEESRTVVEGPAAFAMQMLSDQRVRITPIESGTVRTFGRTNWTWLHPPPQREYRRGNDASMVVAIQTGQRRVLMTGDIQREAIEELLRHNAEALRADVMELPHHGSYNDRAVQLVQHAQPRVVMQSTGWSRWQRDRWSEALKGIDRLVTARDGACTVEIMPDGTIGTQSFARKDAP